MAPRGALGSVRRLSKRVDSAVIGDNSIVAEHNLVRVRQEFPPNLVIAGNPARLIQECDSPEANLMNTRM